MWGGASLHILSFEAAESVEHDTSAVSDKGEKISDRARIEALEQMLRHAQETSLATIEELETHNAALQHGYEEMRANETLLTFNEERKRRISASGCQP